jgi:ASC-1-like (ASCH) protein
MKEMHPTLADNYILVNDLIISEGSQTARDQAGRPMKGASYTNLALRDNRASTDILNIYHQNIKELANQSKASIPISEENTLQDVIENERIAQFFQKLPLVSFLQSGLNTTDTLSMGRIMPTEKTTQLIESSTPKFQELLNKDLEEMLQDDVPMNILENYYYKFNSHNNPKTNVSIRRRLKNYMMEQTTGEVANRKLVQTGIEPDHTIPMNFDDGDGGRQMRSEFKGKSTFDLVISGDRTATSRSQYAASGVKEGDIIEFYKDFTTKSGKKFTRSVIVKATSNEYPVSDITPEQWSKLEGWTEKRHAELAKKGYVQFTFEVIDIEELTSEEAPDIIEIQPENKNQLESLIRNNPDVIFVLESALDSKPGYYAHGIGKIGEFPNVIGITLRNNLTDTASALWNRKDKEQNQLAIRESLDKISELYNQDGTVKLAFLGSRRGYGAYLTEKVSGTENMRDSDTFRYLTTELFERFGYKNRYGKIVTDVQNLMQKNQKEGLGVVEYKIEIPDEEVMEALNRLRCNI